MQYRVILQNVVRHPWMYAVASTTDYCCAGVGMATLRQLVRCHGRFVRLNCCQAIQLSSKMSAI
jgi:hypothetical protein